MRSLVHAGAGAIVLLAVAGSARQTPPSFKTKITHVQVDVVVTDRDDKPITDLTASEFEVWERGKKQTITDFELVSVPLAGREIDLEAEPAPPSDVASNAPPPRTARAFAFVLDDGTLSTAAIVWTKRWMTEFIGHLHTDDQVAITYVSRSDLGQDFTHDPGLLVRAINNLGAALGSGGDLCRHSVPVMKNVVRSIAAARETRRAVVLLGERWPTILGCVNEVRELYEQATQAGVPIYTFSPLGMMAPELGLDGPLEMQTPEARAARDRTIKDGKEHLIEMALNTGGRAFVYQSDSPRAIRELVTENGSYYLLGYYPNPDLADGKYHDIDVKVTRPGTRVRARAGYTATKVATPFAPKPRLQDALGDGLPGGDLLVNGFVAPVSLAKNQARAALTLDVAYPAAEGDGRRQDDELRLAWVAIDPDARIRASGQNNFRISLRQADRAPLAVSINHALDLPKDVRIVRVVIASTALARQGVVHLPVTVPVWTGRTLELTPPLIGTRPDPTSIVVGLGGSARLLPFQPTTARQFTNADRLQVFSRVYAVAATDVSVQIVVTRAGALVRETPVPLTPSASDKGVLECRVTMALADLPAGSYVLELRATAQASAARRQVPFEIK